MLNEYNKAAGSAYLSADQIDPFDYASALERLRSPEQRMF
jgi:hypothetical protein